MAQLVGAPLVVNEVEQGAGLVEVRDEPAVVHGTRSDWRDSARDDDDVGARDDDEKLRGARGGYKS